MRKPVIVKGEFETCGIQTHGTDLDKLENIFILQKNFCSNFVDFNNLSDEQRDKLTRDYILCLVKEITEVLDLTNYKQHKLGKVKPDREHLKEELVDTFKYFLNLCLVWDISANELFRKFLEKDLKNWKRLETEVTNNNE